MRRVEKWVEVKAPVSRVFWLFNSLNTFPLWLPGIERVQFAGPRRARWTARGGALEWETEATTFEPNRRLVWRSVGGRVEAEGDVTFEETRRGSTLLRVVLGYGPSGGSSEAEVTPLLGDDPDRQFEQALEEFRQLAEQAAEEAAGEEIIRPVAAASRPEAWPAPGPAGRQPSGAHLAANGVRQARPLPAEAPAPRPVAPRRIIIDPHADPYELPRPVTDPAPGARRSARGPAADLFEQRRQVISRYLAAVIVLALLLIAAYFLLHRGQADVTAVEPARPAVAQNAPASAAPPAADARPETTPEPAVFPSPAPTRPAAKSPEAESQTEIQTAIDGWVAATNDRDVTRLIRYYASSLRQYYLQSNVARDSVRADKARLLKEVDAIRISAGKPQFSFEPGGRVAEVRFRKQYEFSRRGKPDRGAVEQQLFFAKDGRRWWIVSERDLKKIS